MMTNLIMVKAPPSYNAIMGCPTLNNLQRSTLASHLNMKFPTPMGVGEIHDKQVLVHESYVQELRSVKGGLNVIKPQDYNRTPSPPPEFIIGGRGARGMGEPRTGKAL